MTQTVLEILGFLVLLVLSGFFSSSEVAFFSINPLALRRLKAEHPARGAQVEFILSSPTRLLSTILVGNTLVNVAIPTFVYAVANRVWAGHGELPAILISLLGLIIFGEIGPKRVAVAHPERLARLYAPILIFFIRALAPLRFFMEKITSAAAHLFHPHGRSLTEEEFESVVEASGETGVLEPEEHSMLKGVIRLEDLKASDVMTPRVDLIGIDLDDPGENIVETALRARVRKLPLYRGSLDHVVGMLDVRPFLMDPEHNYRTATRPPLYIPETSSLDKVLAQFLQQGRRTAIVVDEYGGTAGIVTRGDILEEIVGDIADEKGGHELLFDEIGPGRWLLDGRVNLEAVGGRLGLAFEEEGIDRIAGWMAARLERMPRPGDLVELQDLLFTVRQMRKHRVSLVEVRRKETA